jgi:hypothetical protein
MELSQQVAHCPFKSACRIGGFDGRPMTLYGGSPIIVQSFGRIKTLVERRENTAKNLVPLG